MKLSHKFLAAILSYTLLLIILMAGSVAFFANRNFSEYVTKVELENLDVLAQGLAESYAKSGGWDSFRDNPQAWGQTVMHYAENLRPNRMGAKPAASKQGMQSRKGRAALPPPPDAMDGQLRRLSLFDADKKIVFGNPQIKGQSLLPITLDGKTIGHIGLKQRDHLQHPLDSQFLRRQTKVFAVISLAALILGGAASFFLARKLTNPIKALTQGVQKLQTRQFDARISLNSRDELGELARTFNSMAQTLARYEAARKQWIVDVAHELRTPLSVLQVEIEAMQDRIKKVDDNALESLRAEVLHLGRIVQDLHELSLAESKMLTMDKREIQPLSVLQETLQRFMERCSKEGLMLENRLPNGPGPAALADKDRLIQLFSNLMENAIRYTDKPGKLIVGQRISEDELILFFEDSGPGVDEEHLDRLFDRFYRTDASRSRNKGGSGIGLALCKSITEAHGGRIRALKGDSGGLRVETVLPITKASPKE
ncbi:two-component system, OmpR family, sensor histidine kinase BaeS [Desulfatibacillum alkenivorans DSM 16219]|jgi:two-component system sensor histidine kinase BaeS|uniref:histidine kinase n=1 Tax=Desulfatibacillum alkenivorans DSM 16219 TaxID=1121393 RepID=A0A1M6XC29_9BACT|nr:ATP-binding protein [Desulfatibacillum alkenivorans]SHL03439.1 two-component system, OmpR family, sensor histidine kinase BaeS [Desulfatibacillum alkenivorans DSM 16219]